MKKSEKGQSLVENVFVLPIMAIIVFSIAWFGDVMLTRQQLLIAARYGTDLIYNTNLNDQQIRGAIRNYLCDRSVVNKPLNPEFLTDERIRVSSYRHPKDNIFRSLSRDIGSLISFSRISFTRSYVEIDYPFELPELLFGDQNNPFKISARSELIAYVR